VVDGINTKEKNFGKEAEASVDLEELVK